MNKIAQFSKVSFEQFFSSWIDIFGIKPEIYEEKMVHNVYNALKLPTRATSGSAGYDFKCPCDFCVKPGESIKIPTGIRCKMFDGWVLHLYPRSSYGFKYRMQLDNTVGIIDGDYFNSSNEGHIIVKVHNGSENKKTLCMKKGDNFVQGIFLPYGITINDEVNSIRDGGFGSTGR